MVIVTGSVTARPDTFETLLDAALAHVRRSRLEEGCLLHSVMVDAENPLRLVFFEQWSDRAALEAHFRQPGSGEFMSAVRELAAESTRVQTFEVAP